ncbi:MAG: hypothetical protein WC820_06130 [Spirochaetales bacterium]|jgi:hypothetical protein
MNAKRSLLSGTMGFLVLIAGFAQGADPKTVTPAWVMEKQFEQQQAGQPAATSDTAKATKAFNVFFLGYDYPTLSGPLADDLASWSGPINFSLGMESSMGSGSSMLTGLEVELFVTINDAGSRFLMHDMAMIGYSFNLAPLRFNLGGRVGLSMLDVMGPVSYTGLGLVFGPEASLYFAIDPSFWLWVRGRYSMASYISMDSGSTISAGNDSLNCLSLEAGLAFKL